MHRFIFSLLVCKIGEERRRIGASNHITQMSLPNNTNIVLIFNYNFFTEMGLLKNASVQDWDDAEKARAYSRR